MPLAHHTAPSSPTREDKQMPIPRGQQHRKTVTTAEEDIQQAHVCDVKPGKCGPWWPQRIQNLVQTQSLSMTARQENAFLTGSPKQDVARGLLTLTPSRGRTANHHIKPGNGWAPAQEGRPDTCWRCLPGTHSLPVSQGFCPDLVPTEHVTNDPRRCCGPHPSTCPTRTQIQVP